MFRDEMIGWLVFAFEIVQLSLHQHLFLVIENLDIVLAIC